MMDLYSNLQMLCQTLWRPFSADRSERDSADGVDRLVFAAWLACVPIAAWMAIGGAPWWLVAPAVLVLWVLGILYFFFLGLAPLAVPVFRVWLAAPQNRETADALTGSSDEWDATYEDRAKWTEKMKSKGVLREDYELPPKEREDIQDTLDRNSLDRPTLHRAVKIAGVVLIVALIVGDQPLLATFYAFPTLAWLAIDGLRRILPGSRAAPDDPGPTQPSV